MTAILTIRRAHPSDLAAVDRLLATSYARQVAADYPPSVRVTALPLLARANPRLLASGRYFLAQDGAGRLLAAGGWSLSGGGAEVRHVVTDHRHTRQGIGRRLLSRVVDDAAAAGCRRLDCLATRTAVPFYAALGFTAMDEVQIALRPGIPFPVVRMQRPLPGG
jgi:N-acetylglutamate synthase-like GNAT family acetyltransferase